MNKKGLFCLCFVFLGMTGCIPQIKELQGQVDQASKVSEDLLKKLVDANKKIVELTREQGKVSEMLKQLPPIMEGQKNAFEQLDARVKALEMHRDKSGKKRGFK